MKIDKAAEILTDLLSDRPQFPPDDRRTAVKLGIEALKAVSEARGCLVVILPKLLPGETHQ